MANFTLNNATVVAQITGAISKDYPGHTNSTTFNIDYTKDYSDGTGASQGNMLVAFEGKLDKSGTVDIDLGSAVNVYGETVTFTAIKALQIRNKATTTDTDIDVGGAASNPITSLFADASDKATVKSQGTLLFATAEADGYEVVNNSADQLRLTNTSAVHRAEYEVMVLGEVADDNSSSSSSYSTASSESSSSST